MAALDHPAPSFFWLVISPTIAQSVTARAARVAGMVALADVQRFGAFSNADAGGNPIGVVVGEAWLSDTEMLSLAKQVGYAATAFAVSETRGATRRWRARFFAPEMEIPLSGSGVVALGAALGAKYGKGRFDLMTNTVDVAVDVDPDGERWKVSFNAPRTHTRVVSSALAAEFLQQFGWTTADLARDLPPAVANAGANHLVLALKDRATLKAMRYDLAAMKPLMRANDLSTIALVFKETDKLVHMRNAFAIGGVLEDPATGEAAAALGAYLRDRGRPPFDRDGNFEFDVQQGDDMFIASRLNVCASRAAGSPVRVSGVVRKIMIQPAVQQPNAAGPGGGRLAAAQADDAAPAHARLPDNDQPA